MCTHCIATAIRRPPAVKKMGMKCHRLMSCFRIPSNYSRAQAASVQARAQCFEEGFSVIANVAIPYSAAGEKFRLKLRICSFSSSDN